MAWGPVNTGGIVSSAASGGAGSVVKITFDSDFIGQQYVVTDGESESKAGIVPSSGLATVTVTKANTTYTVTCNGHSTTITTGDYYGEYSVKLTVFTATLTVNTNCPGCTVMANAVSATVTATADENGVATLTLPSEDIYTVSAATSFGITLARSNTATVFASANESTYEVAVNFTKLTVTAPAGVVLIVNCDGLSVTLTSTGNDTFCLPSGRECWVEASANNKTKFKYVLLSEFNNTSVEFSYNEITANVFSVIWDGSSSHRWSRDENSGFFVDPVPYMAGMSADQCGSPFDDIYPWGGMVKEERTGGTMVKIPQFFYALEKANIGTGLRLRIATKRLPGFYSSPAHMNRGDGHGERDFVYVGRYHCAVNTYKSTAGVQPQRNVARSAFRTNTHALGTNIWQIDWLTWWTIQMLYLVEFTDWDSQGTIGVSGSLANMGASDSMPYHTGTMAAARTTGQVGTQYRNLEDLWGNRYDWVDGCYYNAEGMSVILNPNNFSKNANGILIGLPTHGWPSKFEISDNAGFPMIYPVESSGSATTFSCDSWSFNASGPCLYVGGSNTSANCGLFFVYYGSDSASGGIGGRLLELP